MRQVVIATTLVLSVALVGCKSKAPDSATQAAQTQQQFSRVEPGTKVGTVSIVLADYNMLAATGLQDLAIGDTIVVMTPEKRVIGAGTVVDKRPENIHVRYDVNEKGRSPRVGDLVVKPAH